MSDSSAVDGAVEKIQLMDNSPSTTAFKSPFHCGWEWHLRKESGSCFAIYALASRVVAKKKGKIFWPSAANVALQFELNKTTAHRGMRRLRELGFFEWQGINDNGTNRYRVIPHKEWAQKHPGQCAIFKPRSEPSEADDTGEALPPSKPKSTAGPAGKGQQNANAQERTDKTSGIAQKSEATALARELTFLSDGKICFHDKHRARLARILNEFTAEEIKSVFKPWLGDQDLSDPKNVSFLPGQFVQAVDGLAYSARRRKKEAEVALIARDRRAAELQAEAEDERREAERKRWAEDSFLDPVFGDLLCTDATECVQ